MDENAVGTCAELIFAPIDASFADDAPLLPSGFRIIPLDSGKVVHNFHGALIIPIWFNSYLLNFSNGCFAICFRKLPVQIAPWTLLLLLRLAQLEIEPQIITLLIPPV